MKLFNFLLRRVYNLTTLEGKIDVVFTSPQKDQGYIKIDGEQLPIEEQRELVIQAKQMLRMKGRETIRRSMCADATDKLVNKSQTIDDMVAGKVMLYTIDIEDQLLEKIASLSH